MNIYMTSGTPAFMASLRSKYPKEMMIAMQAQDNSLLLHETDGKTVFQTPRRYEVIASFGTLEEDGYFVFHNIPVTDEGRPIFEHRFQERASALDNKPGLIAFRLLRPLHSDTYIIVTEWFTNESYALWKNSPFFLKNLTEAGVDNTPHIFTSASSITTYTAKTEDDDG